jgi:hypothetical protein
MVGVQRAIQVIQALPIGDDRRAAVWSSNTVESLRA